jgi:hemolysin activation/secretion protein
MKALACLFAVTACVGPCRHTAVAQPTRIAQAEQLRDVLPQRRGGGAPELPPLEPASPALPAAPPSPPVPAAPLPEAPPTDKPAFLLKGVRVDGNSVLDQSDLDRVVAPFLNRPAGLRDLEAIRQGITLLYVDRGYINSGAVIPDQTVDNGILQVQVIEAT